MLYVADLRERRERTFLVLAGIFLCAMTLLNVIGITRFIQLGPMALAVGVLPYPLTFLCTDLICELYGKARANFLVSVGLGLNFFILLVLLLGNSIPAVPAESMPPWQILQLAAPVALPNGEIVEQQCRPVPADLRHHLRRDVRLHAGLHRRPVLRRAAVSFLEAGHQGQAPVDTQQLQHPDEPDGRFGDGDHGDLRRRLPARRHGRCRPCWC